MSFKPVLRIILPLMFAGLLGCAAQGKVVKEPPPFPGDVAGAAWGMQVNAVKEAVETYRDNTEKDPFALYAFRKEFDLPATVSYFFTPKSRKLYRVDVTFDDPGVYEAVRGKLAQMFKDPAFTQPDREVYLWENSSVVILQKNPSSVQVSFMSGPLLKLNNEEGGEPIKEPPRESYWRAVFPIP
jgi:hypothetical protein